MNITHNNKEMTRAYIIKNKEVLGIIETLLTSGNYDASYKKCEEKINANREYNLVNAFTIKLSRDKKWEKNYRKNNFNCSSVEIINDDEFYLF